MDRNDMCWCGSGKKYKKCHLLFDEKLHHLELQGCEVPSHNIIKTQKDIEGIKKSAEINK